MSTKRDYYEILGIGREAGEDDVRRAFKKKAVEFHPDRNPNDPTAEQKYKEANEAFQVLTDRDKRRIYDQFGHAGLEGGGAGSGFDGGMSDVFSHMQDLFSEMFSGGGGRSGGRRGEDLRVQVRLTLREAAFGCKKDVTVRTPTRCRDCQGSGARSGTKPEACGQCRGTGQVSTARSFIMFATTCPRCQGQGMLIKHPCGTCQGHGLVETPRTVVVTFPAGIDAGQRLRVPGQGMSSQAQGRSGDLYVDVEVEADPRFERDAANLLTRIEVSMTEAALGTTVQVPSLEDDGAYHDITVEPGIQPGTEISLKGMGVPRLDGRGRGALVVQVQVAVPKELSPRARQLLEELDSELRAGAPVTQRRASTG